MKLLVFGNLLIEKDNLAIRILPKLRKEFPEIEFKEFDPTENLEAEIENKKLMILDVIERIKEVMVINDLSKISVIKSCSMHDFDLAYNLKLLKKIGLLKSINIIGIPMKIGEEKTLKKIKKIIKNILSSQKEFY